MRWTITVCMFWVVVAVIGAAESSASSASAKARATEPLAGQVGLTFSRLAVDSAGLFHDMAKKATGHGGFTRPPRAGAYMPDGTPVVLFSDACIAPLLHGRGSGSTAAPNAAGCKAVSSSDFGAMLAQVQHQLSSAAAAASGGTNSSAPAQTYLCEWRHESHTVACVLEKHPRLVSVEETIPVDPHDKHQSCRRPDAPQGNDTAAAAGGNATHRVLEPESGGDLVVKEGPHRRAMLHLLCSERLPPQARTGSQLRNDTGLRAPAGSNAPEAPFAGAEALRAYVTVEEEARLRTAARRMLRTLGNAACHCAADLSRSSLHCTCARTRAGPPATAEAGDASSAVATDAEHAALSSTTASDTMLASNSSEALDTVRSLRQELKTRMYRFWSVMQEVEAVSKGRNQHAHAVLADASKYTLAAIPVASGPTGIVSAGPLIDGAAVAAAQAESIKHGGPVTRGAYPGSASASALKSAPAGSGKALSEDVLAMPYRDLGSELPASVTESPVLHPVVLAARRALERITPPHTATAAAEAVTLTLLTRRLRASTAELFSVYPPAIASTSALKQLAATVTDDSAPLPLHFDRSGVARSAVGPIVAARVRQLSRQVAHLRRLCSLAAARASKVSNADPRASWKSVEAVVRQRMALGDSAAAAAEATLGSDASAALEQTEEEKQEAGWLESLADAGAEETAEVQADAEAEEDAEETEDEAAIAAPSSQEDEAAPPAALVEVAGAKAVSSRRSHRHRHKAPAGSTPAAKPEPESESEHAASVARLAAETGSRSAAAAVADAAVRGAFLEGKGGGLCSMWPRCTSMLGGTPLQSWVVKRIVAQAPGVVPTGARCVDGGAVLGVGRVLAPPAVTSTRIESEEASQAQQQQQQQQQHEQHDGHEDDEEEAQAGEAQDAAAAAEEREDEEASENEATAAQEAGSDTRTVASLLQTRSAAKHKPLPLPAFIPSATELGWSTDGLLSLRRWCDGGGPMEIVREAVTSLAGIPTAVAAAFVPDFAQGEVEKQKQAEAEAEAEAEAQKEVPVVEPSPSSQATPLRADFGVLEGERALDAAAALGEWRRAGRAVRNLNNAGWASNSAAGAMPVRLTDPDMGPSPDPQPPSRAEQQADLEQAQAERGSELPTPAPQPPREQPVQELAEQSLLQLISSTASDALLEPHQSAHARSAAAPGTAVLLQAWAASARQIDSSSSRALADAMDGEARTAAKEEQEQEQEQQRQQAESARARIASDSFANPRERLLANAAQFRFSRHSAAGTASLGVLQPQGQDQGAAQPQAPVEAAAEAAEAAAQEEESEAHADVVDEENGGPLVRRIPVDVAAAARSAGRRVASLLLRLNGTLACACLHAGAPVSGLAMPPQPAAGLTEAAVASSLAAEAVPEAGAEADEAAVDAADGEAADRAAVEAVAKALDSPTPALLQAAAQAVASRSRTSLRGAPKDPYRKLYERKRDGSPSAYMDTAHGEGDGIVLPSDRRARSMDDLSAFFTALERFTPHRAREAAAAFAPADLLALGTTGRSDPRAAMAHSKEAARPLGALPVSLIRGILVYIARERERKARWPNARLDMQQARLLADVTDGRLAHALGDAALAGGAGDPARQGQVAAQQRASDEADAIAHGRAPEASKAEKAEGDTSKAEARAPSLLELEASVAASLSSLSARRTRRHADASASRGHTSARSQAELEAMARHRARVTVKRSARAPGTGASLKGASLPSEAALNKMLPEDAFADVVMFSGGLAQLTPTRLGLPPATKADVGRWVFARMQEWDGAFSAEKDEVASALAILTGEAPWSDKARSRASKAGNSSALHRAHDHSWPVRGIDAEVVNAQLAKLGAKHGMLASEMARMQELLAARIARLKELARLGLKRAAEALSALNRAIAQAAAARDNALASAKAGSKDVAALLADLKRAIDTVASGALVTGAKPEDIAECTAIVAKEEASKNEGATLAESVASAMRQVAVARRALALALERHPSKPVHSPAVDALTGASTPPERHVASTLDTLHQGGMVVEADHPEVAAARDALVNAEARALAAALREHTALQRCLVKRGASLNGAGAAAGLDSSGAPLSLAVVNSTAAAEAQRAAAAALAAAHKRLAEERRLWEEAVVRLARPKTCLQLQGLATGGGDGVYTIFPPDDVQFRGVKVYCDMTTDGGGWTLVSYGPSGNVGGPLGVSHGHFSPTVRNSTAGLNGLWVAQASHEVAISWTPHGAPGLALQAPGGPMSSYGVAAAYAIPVPATTDLALTPAPPPQTCASDRGDYTVTTVRCLDMPKRQDRAAVALKEDRQAAKDDAEAMRKGPKLANDVQGEGGGGGAGFDASPSRASSVDGSGAKLPPPEGTKTEGCQLPARMYTGTQSLGVCHGHAYGVVLRGARDEDCDGPLAMEGDGSRGSEGDLVPGAAADAPRQGSAQLGIMVGVDDTPGCSGMMDQGRDGFLPGHVAVWMR